MLNEESEIRLKPDIVLRDEDDGAFLFDPSTGRICYLNEIGATIWRLCENPITQNKVVGIICSEYSEVSKEKVTQDCSIFLDNLYLL